MDNMKEKISHLVRSTFGFLLVGIFLCGVVLLYGWFLLSHYNALVQSFELLGYDQKPLLANRLFGWIFEAFGLGDATQCDLYAGSVTLLMGLSITVVCFLISQLILHLKDRAIFLRTGDRDSAKNVEFKIYYEILPWLILWLLLAVPMTLWDIKLFIFRNITGTMGIDDPESAFSLKKLDILIKEYGDRLSIDVIDFSPYGYAAGIFIASFLLDFIFIRFRDRWELLMDAISGLSLEDPNPQKEALQSQVAPEIGGIPARQNPEDVHGDAMGNEQEAVDVTIQPPQRVEMDEEVEVIGDSGRRIRRLEALTDLNRYYVDSEGRVWDRMYYTSLHDNHQR